MRPISVVGGPFTIPAFMRSTATLESVRKGQPRSRAAFAEKRRALEAGWAANVPSSVPAQEGHTRRLVSSRLSGVEARQHGDSARVS